MDNTKTAEEVTLQSFLNCYIRETGAGEQKAGRLYIDLPHQEMELMAPLHYASITGRHLFSFPLLYKAKRQAQWLDADLVTASSLLLKELALEYKTSRHVPEAMKRILLSYENIAFFLENRSADTDSLYRAGRSFIESEQSLLYGHLFHPTPKSRQGMNEQETLLYSPETKGRFSLHYFWIHRSIAEAKSADGETAEEKIFSLFSEEDRQNWTDYADYILIPVHPLQASVLLEEPHIQSWIDDKTIIDAGRMGPAFAATSSIRTLYNEESDIMLKLSIPVKVTNSLRVNKRMELERGLVIHEILNSSIGGQIRDYFPGFSITKDPAYLNVQGEAESGFETVIRENPFKGENKENTSLIAGLCQDPAEGQKSHLYRVIESISKEENRTMEDVSLDWFNRYLSISLQPILWLYFTHGIALEAHQQNAVLTREQGWPKHFYYRDNQGYYFAASKETYLESFVPELKDKSHTVCSDALVDERLRYYFFYNHIFGLINAFGTSGLIEEELLLDAVRTQLEQMKPVAAPSSSALIESLLEEQSLPCKANLLTTFRNMDELTGTLEEQSVYTNVTNPLAASSKSQSVSNL